MDPGGIREWGSPGGPTGICGFPKEWGRGGAEQELCPMFPSLDPDCPLIPSLSHSRLSQPHSHSTAP